ncbi:MAG: hypothetical protein KF832_27695 [Caldilineaceae bacterium]|nr:hypothetical protein [Caldilineaceae bacterium]
MKQTSEIDRLLTAAVVNRRFCRLLLSNPMAALTHGYRGEAFRLNPDEVHRLCKIRATSLRDFAIQLLTAAENAETTVEASDSYPSLALMALSSKSV